ncbi:MAG: NYN domain-containing protein [Azoarcus sp.]|nr:MAG: NYN domain-containing protein [Azoarcus sp.]
MKSALFVDFDNVYSGLRRLDQDTADQFARNPTVWMNWLIKSLEMPEPVAPGAKRRVLVRRCYLNPQAYQRFRPSFNLAGFEIIDCPALTSEGKTSTDINMVLDIVDLLQHETRYDEFIVFSADADFTPVLRKLRRWDRRTTVLAIGFPSAAYRASADLLIDQDDFVRNALSFDETAAPPPVEAPAPSPSSPECGPLALQLILQAVREAAAPVSLPKVASLLLSRIDGLDASSWAGFGSFRALLESLPLHPLIVCWESGGTIHDPQRHVLFSTPNHGAGNGKTANLTETVIATIRNEVAKAGQPVPCGRLATVLIGLDGSLAADWGGKGSFRKFVESLNTRPVEFNWNGSGGVAYDPSSSTAQPSQLPQAATADWSDKNLFKIAKQIHELTDVPLLTPEKYQNLIALIARDVAETPFNLMETGKRVRDRSKETGFPVSRADVNHVLRGLIMRGHTFEEGPNDAPSLAQSLANNVRSLCLREQIVLDEPTERAIRDWIGGIKGVRVV